MEHDKLSPLAVDIDRFSQHVKAFLDAARHSVGNLRSKREPISVRRSGSDVPEFDDVLGRDTNPVASRFDRFQRIPGVSILGVVSTDSPNKDVRVDENVLLMTLIILCIDPLSGEGAIG